MVHLLAAMSHRPFDDIIGINPFQSLTLFAFGVIDPSENTCIKVELVLIALHTQA